MRRSPGQLGPRDPSCGLRQLSAPLETRTVGERNALQSLDRASDERREHLSRAAFENVLRASRRHLPHALDPAHGMIGLSHQRLLDPRGIAAALRIDVLANLDCRKTYCDDADRRPQ